MRPASFARPDARIRSLAVAAAVWAAAAMCLVSLLALLGEAAVHPLLGSMRGVLEGWLPEFRVHSFEIVSKAGLHKVLAAVQLVEPMWIGRRVIRDTVFATAEVTLGTIWQAFVVAIATALAWPRSWRARCLAAAFAATGSLLLTIVLMPTMLAGMVIRDIYWHSAVGEIEPFIMTLPRLLEDGGRLMLGFVAGGCAVGLAGLVARGFRGDGAGGDGWRLRSDR